MRITYPEGAIQKKERYENDSLFVVSAFKPQDLKWLRHMIFNEKLVYLLQKILRNMVISALQRTHVNWLGKLPYPVNNPYMGENDPLFHSWDGI
ncbi:hypothetical protein NFI96_019868 [Prochilodus magdalenae]|nr:hypothetical protein NFI96_019868 [Prochilodus magdalenae]